MIWWRPRRSIPSPGAKKGGVLHRFAEHLLRRLHAALPSCLPHRRRGTRSRVAGGESSRLSLTAKYQLHVHFGYTLGQAWGQVSSASASKFNRFVGSLTGLRTSGNIYSWGWIHQDAGVGAREIRFHLARIRKQSPISRTWYNATAKKRSPASTVPRYRTTLLVTILSIFIPNSEPYIWRVQDDSSPRDT